MQYLLSLVLLIIPVANSLKILTLFPHPGKSHVDAFLPLTKALARKGHHVTVISHFPLQENIENYTDINLSTGEQLVNVIDMKTFKKSKLSMFFITFFLDSMSEHFCQQNFQSSILQNFIRSNDTYDVILLEYFNSDCFAGFIQKFEAPVIGLSSCALMPWTSERFGNPISPAYIPNILSDHSDKMDFFERFLNFLGQNFHQWYYNSVMITRDYIISARFFKNLQPLQNIVHKSSLMLVNTHFSVNLPRALVPAVVEVGGLHIGKVKLLPRVSRSVKAMGFFSA